jgi:hypothetical protein
MIEQKISKRLYENKVLIILNARQTCKVSLIKKTLTLLM